MLMNDGCKLAIAAGIDDPDSPIGTDPIKVMEAIESVADTDHVLVMMDIGSALLSAETALDLLDPAIAAKVRLCAAPLVEGRWRPPSAPPPAPGSTRLSPMP